MDCAHRALQRMRMPIQIDTPTMERLAGAALIVAAVAGITIIVWQRNSSWRSVAQETARVRDLYDREASRYDRIVRIPERLLFSGGRAWAASQAVGSVLEIAIGTGETFRITGRSCGSVVSRSARRCSRSPGRVRRRSAATSLSTSAMHNSSPMRANGSIPSSARCHCARFPTSGEHFGRRSGCYVRPDD